MSWQEQSRSVPLPRLTDTDCATLFVRSSCEWMVVDEGSDPSSIFLRLSYAGKLVNGSQRIRHCQLGQRPGYIGAIADVPLGLGAG